MSSDKEKIFGIGLSKTGTSSLARALTFLGYSTRDYMGITRYVPGDIASISKEDLDLNDAFTDTPVPSFYRELDRVYPGSKFILTVREQNGWLESCRKQFTRKLEELQTEAMIELFKDIYGCFEFNDEKYLLGYTRFKEGVLEYFRERPDDLLVINIAAGEGWEKLCPFLQKSIPDIPFPKANVTRIGWTDIQDIVTIARQAGLSIRVAHNILYGLHDKGERGLSIFIERLRIYRGYAGCLLWGGKNNPLEAAGNRANAIIEDSLRKLNPDIPVISRNNHDVPFSERRMWNHFWLVDPVDGDFNNYKNSPTVNIALIQDRCPILGVIYEPINDTVYYARGNNGAYKCVGKGKPVRFEKDRILTDHPGKPDNSMKKNNTNSMSFALRCLETHSDAVAFSESVREWKVAAAHAFLKSAGINLMSMDSGCEISYNKADFIQDSFIIK